MTELMTGWALRQAAEAKGWAISHEQLVVYQRWGLIPERDPSGPGWDACTVQRLITIRELGESVRSLARRTLLLRMDERFQDIPFEAIREAMIEIIPTIRAPVRKMIRIDNAMKELPAWRDSGPRRPHPLKQEWVSILADTPLPIFESRVTGDIYLASSISAFVKDTELDISAIPFEERMTLLTIRDFAHGRDLRRTELEIDQNRRLY